MTTPSKGHTSTPGGPTGASRTRTFRRSRKLKRRVTTAQSIDTGKKHKVSVTVGEAIDDPLDPLEEEPDDSRDNSSAWARCARDLWQHDEESVKAWKEEIDTLLVFAGLFSAILTAFEVQIAFNADGSSGSSSGGSPTQSNPSNGNSQGSCGGVSSGLSSSSCAPVVAAHTLWFASLICSLASASMGISVKQWLNYYSTRNSTISRQSVRIRQFRYQGLISYHVVGIIHTLPVLLQAALALFFCGLLIVLWMVNPVVAGVTTAIVALLLGFTWTTILLPAFTRDAPFKSAPAWWTFLTIRWLRIAMRRVWRHAGHDVPAALYRLVVQESSDSLSMAENSPSSGSRRYRNWTEREVLHVRSLTSDIDRHALATADATMMNDAFLEEVVRPCLQDVQLEAALSCFFAILHNRAHNFTESLPDWHADEHDGRAILTMAEMTIDMLLRISDTEDCHFYPYRRTLFTLLERLLDARPATSEASYGRLLPALTQMLKTSNPEEPDFEAVPDAMHEVAFDWIVTLSIEEQVDVVSIEDAQAIIAHAMECYRGDDGQAYIRACLAAVHVCSKVKDEEVYQHFRPKLQEMLASLDTYLSASTSFETADRDTLRAFFVYLQSVVTMARRDHGLVSFRLIESLESIFKISLRHLAPTGSIREKDVSESQRVQSILKELHGLRRILKHSAEPSDATMFSSNQ